MWKKYKDILIYKLYMNIVVLVGPVDNGEKDRRIAYLLLYGLFPCIKTLYTGEDILSTGGDKVVEKSRKILR